MPAFIDQSSKNTPILKADTGSTGTYLKKEHKHSLKKRITLDNGPCAKLPNGEKIQASEQGLLPFDSSVKLPSLVFPDLNSESLLSIGQLCDHNCAAIFDKHFLHVFKDDKRILTGYRNQNDRLWDVPFPSPQHVMKKTNYIIRQDQNKTELAQYLHACAFSPAISTFQYAIKNGFF